MPLTLRLGPLGLAFLTAAGAWAAEPTPLEQLVGTWRGTSTCVNRQVAPACNDEVVIYEVRPAARPDTARLEADKVVGGKRLSMGELEFTYDARARAWSSELQTPRVHAVWSLVVREGRLSGTLTDKPTNQVVRVVELTPDRTPASPAGK